MGRTSFLVKIIYKFFLKTHQQNLNFSPYYRGVFFAVVELNVNKV